MSARMRTLEVPGPVAVVGDIHGHAQKLDALLRRLDALAPRMPLFFVGDVIDRGPASREVVTRLLERNAQGARGNHEEWFIRWVEGLGFESDVLSPFFGGDATLASYGVAGRRRLDVEHARFLVPKEHRRLLASLPIALRIVVDDVPFWLVHAGVAPPSQPLPRLLPKKIVPHLVAAEPDHLLWGGGPPDEMLPVDAPVVSGHRPRRQPIDAGHALCIDTGCGIWDDGLLTAVILPSRRFVSV